jgi:prepilin-type N-terminal cleavage/methylation domain-containing protein
MQKSSRGYTLAELIVVILIISIFVVISAPYLIGWLHQYRLQAAVNSLMNHLRAARLLAIYKGVTHQVQLKKFDEGNYYQIVEDPGKADKVVMSIGRVVLHERFGEVRLKSIPLSGRLSFSPQGTSSDGTILLENQAGAQVKIVVNSYGRVRSEYL